jgi:tetratricopeptide (TPR) repeat protein
VRRAPPVLAQPEVPPALRTTISGRLPDPPGRAAAAATVRVVSSDAVRVGLADDWSACAIRARFIRSAIACGEFDAALSVMAAAAASVGPTPSAAVHDELFVLLQLTRYSEVLRRSEEMLRTCEDDLVTLSYRADALMCRERPEQALHCLNRVLLLLNLGANAASGVNGALLASARKKRALRLSTLSNKATVLICLQDLAGAVSTLKEVLAADSMHSAATYNLAICLWQQGRGMEAAEVWLRFRNIRLDMSSADYVTLWREASIEYCGYGQVSVGCHVMGSVSVPMVRLLDVVTLRLWSEAQQHD